MTDPDASLADDPSDGASAVVEASAADEWAIPRAARRWAAGGVAAAFVVFWLIGTMGSPTELFSSNAVTGNFFDAQARSLMAGHFDVPKEVALIEGIVTDRGTQIYFGIFPSLLRMPILAITHSLDGNLALPSQLLAVVVLCIATVRLARLAQLQVARRRPAVMDLSPRWYAVAAAAPVLFSPVLFLASRGMVYHEAILWGVAGALWGLDAALRWWLRPTWWRLGVATLAATVAIGSRPSAGLSPALALFLFAIVLAVRRQWRTAVWPAAAGGFAMATYAVVNYGRFRQLWGAPFGQQVAYKYSPVQQQAVAETGGTLVSPRFAFTTVTRYFDPLPDVMHPTRLFPFVEWGRPVTAKLGAPVFIDDTGSLPTAAPVLLLCAAVGVWWLYRCRGRTSWSVLVAASWMASSVTLVFWAVSHRYMNDLVPSLMMLALPGGWVALDWTSARPRGRRIGVYSALAVLTVFALWGQIGISIWSHHFAYLPVRSEQVAFVEMQYSIDGALFGGTPPRVDRVAADPIPDVRRQHVAIVGDCDAVYFGAEKWVPMERAADGARRAVVVAKEAADEIGESTVLVASGLYWSISAVPSGTPGTARLVYSVLGGGSTPGRLVHAVNGQLVLDIVADPWTRVVSAMQGGEMMLLVTDAASRDLEVAPGWNTFGGGDSFCRSLLARMPKG